VKTYFELPGQALHRYSMTGATMGTRYSAVFYAPEGIDTAAIGANLFAAVDQVDRQMSTWDGRSDLSRVNAAPIGRWIAVPDPLVEVLATGMQLGLDSHGAFDIGMGELVNAWGFGPTPRTVRGLAPAPPATGHRPAAELLELDRARGQLRKRGPLSLDLSGIAKGYGVDQLARCLDQWGIRRYLVGIDGEMRARGTKPAGEAWTIAVEKPVYGVREVAGVMELWDTAVATSGDYRQWTEIDGQRYAHTMHPALQRPVSNRLAAVTVLASTCMLADGWATALLVLGEDDGVKLAQEWGMDALFVLRDGDRLAEIATGALVDPAG
jgi:thiamine biosynthesis lipoprotein